MGVDHDQAGVIAGIALRLALATRVVAGARAEVHLRLRVVSPDVKASSEHRVQVTRQGDRLGQLEGEWERARRHVLLLLSRVLDACRLHLLHAGYEGVIS